MPAFTPFLMRGDFDPLQIAIVVLFLVGSFVKWLWDNWQTRRNSGTSRDSESSDTAGRVRRGGGSPPMPARPSPFDEWRKAWKEIQEAARQPQAAAPSSRRPAVPPPLRQQARPAAPVAAVQSAATSARPTEVPAAPPAPSAVASPSVVAKAPPGALLTSLRNLRHDPVLMRQAILMQEVLGPPKALQTPADPAI